MADAEESIADLINKIRSFPAFKRGIVVSSASSGITTHQGDNDTPDDGNAPIPIYGAAIVELYENQLSEAAREKLTIEEVALYVEGDETNLDLLRQILSGGSDVNEVARAVLLKAVKDTAAARREKQAAERKVAASERKVAASERISAEYIASNLIERLSCRSEVSSEDVDGILAMCLVNNVHLQEERRPLDPWKYATFGEASQSYRTIGYSSLCSSCTVKELTGNNVRFMMFAEGKNKVECTRFSFGTVPCNYEAELVGNPCSIDPTFFQDLDLIPATKELLPIHAKRLEMIQHALKRVRRADTLTQFLAMHWFSQLTRALDGLVAGELNYSTRVVSVTGMDSVDVTVEVCNAYLRSQQKDTIEGSGGETVPLKIKGDLAVIASLDDTTNANTSSLKSKKEPVAGKMLQDFLGCKYSIEMKNAFDLLKDSAIPAKSQLIAQSLARSVSRQSSAPSGLPPQVLYSVLFDACCLHVLVHFPRENRAFLSHREIEPGRIACVVAWLHFLSARDDLTVEQFMDFQVRVGDTMQAEIKAAEAERKAGDKVQEGTPGTVPEQPSGRHGRGRDTEEMCLDFTGEEKNELEPDEDEKLATFSYLQNHYRYRYLLPLTEGVLDAFHEDARTGHTMPKAELMARAGFRTIDNTRSNGIA